jgi:predicted DNA-binding protein (MmcQ/YjbR family)
MKRTPIASLEAAVRTHGLSFPEAYEEFPWGERAIKVKGKVFVFMSKEASYLSLSVKLPMSAEFALGFPKAKPTGYGLGKSGWVSARLDTGNEVPLEIIKDWIEESYRAVAPKKLVATLKAAQTDAAPPRPGSSPRPRPRADGAVRTSSGKKRAGPPRK